MRVNAGDQELVLLGQTIPAEVSAGDGRNARRGSERLDSLLRHRQRIGRRGYRHEPDPRRAPLSGEGSDKPGRSYLPQAVAHLASEAPLMVPPPTKQ